jgi:alkanesulfonate monooxygenase SsuD/methylene tetrahydromethanopterin reductase-like flavin-dependent oxidoreductase (luciferase family)
MPSLPESISQGPTAPSRPLDPDPTRVWRIRSDDEALAAAHRLAALFAPGASARDRDRRLPWEELDLWSESGLGGITVPREHGGADVSYATLAEVFVILSAADGSLGQIPQNHYYALEVLRVGGTEAQKSFFYRRVLHASREAGLAHFAASTGIDYARYDLDAPVDYANTATNAIESATRTAQQHGWTRRRLLELFELGGRYPAIVGDAAQVADELQSWIEETGVDGFNLSRTVVPESYEDFVDLVVPELQDRGVYKTAYAEGSLRRKLFDAGDRLPARHAAAQFRHQAALVPTAQ